MPYSLQELQGKEGSVVGPVQLPTTTTGNQIFPGESVLIVKYTLPQLEAVGATSVT